MKVFKWASVASVIWAVIFFCDYVFHLFSITESGTVNTYFGLKIITEMSPTELLTIFELTPKVLYGYLLFILIYISIMMMYTLCREENKN